MASTFTQKKGLCKLGVASAATEYGSAITSVKFTFGADETTLPAVLSTGEGDVELGAKNHTLTLGFMAGLATTALATELSNAVMSDGELFFDVVFDNTIAVSANNPRHTGKIVVSAVELGGDVGALRAQTQTFKIKGGTYAKASV